MKKTNKLWKTAALVAGCLVAVTALTSCGADENTDTASDSKPAVTEITEASENNADVQDEKTSEVTEKQTQADEENEAEAETEAVAETTAESSGESVKADEKEEKTEAEEVKSETGEGSTVVVTEDGIRYERIGASADYSDDEAAKLNEDIKKIQHDAVERHGNWGRSSTEEKQSVYPDFNVTAELMDFHLKNIWKVDTGNPEGYVFYDAATLEPLTVKKLFGDNWADNNTGFTKDAKYGDQEILGFIDWYMNDAEYKLHIKAVMQTNDIEVDIARDLINPDYIGSTNPVPGK